MAVPRNRISTSRRNKRRSHHAKTPSHFSTCVNCQNPHRPHHICTSCGHYKGRSYQTGESEE